MTNPMLSIIVPTKNRHALVKQLIQKIDGTVPDCIEYIIYDNSDLPLQLQINQPDRILYFHDKLHLSVGANFSKALKLSRGPFAAFMGDDDEANHPELVVALSIPNINKYDTIISPIYDLLFHSGSGTRWTGQFRNMTRVKPNLIGRAALRSIHQLSRITRRFSYFWLLSPDLWAVSRGYFGIFKRDLIITGDYEKDSRLIYLSPDAYLIGMLSRANSTLHLDKQLFIPGTSSASTSNLSNSRQHIGAISSQTHFDRADINALPKDIPDSFLPEVIWAASYLSASKKSQISSLHLAIIKQFVRMKYGIDIYDHENRNIATSHLITSIFGMLLGSLFYITNRLMVAVLIMGRYKFSTLQSCDDH